MPLQAANINGYDMAYAEVGSGTPLVLIHGSLCDCRYWKPQMAALGLSYRVLAPSLRRYWPERWDGEGGGFSVTQHVDDVLAFIASLDAGPVHLLGHSRGGRIAFEAARREPRLVRTLTLADPGLPVGPVEDTRNERGAFRQRAMTLLRQGRTDEGLALFIDTVSGADTWRRMVPWFKDMVRDNAATLLAQADEAAPAVEPAQVRAIAQPLLLIGGALSPPPYPAMIEALHNLLPASQRVSIAGSSHGMNLGNPRAFNAALLAFLAS